MKIRMPEVVKDQVEQVLKEILYEEKTLELMDATVNRLKGILGEGYFVGYTPSDLKGEVKFILGTKLSPNSEYTVWTVSLSPAKWEPAPPIDEDEPTGEDGDDQDPPPAEPTEDPNDRV